MKKLVVDVMTLTTVPVVNMNADFSGMPKTAVYGGTMRARLSSQCQKYWIRQNWGKYFEQEAGVRTRYMCDLVDAYLEPLRPDLTKTERMERIAGAMSSLKVLKFPELQSDGKKKRKRRQVPESENSYASSAVFYLSADQAKAAANVLAENDYTDEQVKWALMYQSSLDVLLFGRLAAGNRDFDVESCVQVSHALSVDEVRLQEDAFSCMDDLVKKDGAAYLNEQFFVSGTYFRFASIDVGRLYERLKEYAAQTAVSFVKAFVEVLPEGRKNGCTSSFFPGLIYIAVRDASLNPEGAFMKAVEAGDGVIEEQAVLRLNAYLSRLYGRHVLKPYEDFSVSMWDFTLGQQIPWLSVSSILKKSILEQLEKLKG